MPSSTERYKWLDFVRGLAMLLVVIGHSGVHGTLFKLIYIFHMPLFYMISGCLDKKRDIGFGQYVMNISKKYLVPYLKYSMIGLIITLLLPGIYGAEASFSQVVRYVIGIVLGRGAEAWTGNWGAIWFLLSQFWLLIIVFILNKHLRKYQILICCALGPILSLSLSFIPYIFMDHSTWLLWNIGASLMAVPIYYVGAVLGKNVSKIKEQNIFAETFLAAALIIVGLIVGNMNPITVAFTNNAYGDSILALIEFFIGACFVPMGIILLSVIIYIYIYI